MTNEELIATLRYCFEKRKMVAGVPLHVWCDRAADALEAADEMIDDCVAAIDALDDSNDAYIKENERLKKRIAELEAQNELKDGTITAMATDIGKLRAQLPKWISVDERLPEESGGYIAYIQEPHMIQKADWEEQYDFSFAMQLWFDKQKMLWSDNVEDSYNAYLPAVDTDNAFHVTHWMKLPEPPKGEQE